MAETGWLITFEWENEDGEEETYIPEALSSSLPMIGQTMVIRSYDDIDAVTSGNDTVVVEGIVEDVMPEYTEYPYEHLHGRWEAAIRLTRTN